MSDDAARIKKRLEERGLAVHKEKVTWGLERSLGLTLYPDTLTLLAQRRRGGALRRRSGARGTGKEPTPH